MAIPSHIDSVEPSIDRFLRPGEITLRAGQRLQDLVFIDPPPRLREQWCPISEGAVLREAWAERPTALDVMDAITDERVFFAQWSDGHRVEIGRQTRDMRLRGVLADVSLQRAHLSRAHGVQL